MQTKTHAAFPILTVGGSHIATDTLCGLRVGDDQAGVSIDDDKEVDCRKCKRAKLYQEWARQAVQE